MAAKETAAEKPAENDGAATTKAEPVAGVKHVYRVDLGEGIPTPPIKTATDHE